MKELLKFDLLHKRKLARLIGWLVSLSTVPLLALFAARGHKLTIHAILSLFVALLLCVGIKAAIRIFPLTVCWSISFSGCLLWLSIAEKATRLDKLLVWSAFGILYILFSTAEEMSDDEAVVSEEE